MSSLAASPQQGTLMDSIPPSQGRSKKHHGRRKKRHHKAKPKEMTPEEVLDLSPWAKWILYKKFPYKLVVHIALVVLTTTQVLMINSIFDDYSRAIGSTWASLLFPNGFQTSEERNWGVGYELYTIPDVLNHTQYLLNSYYSLPFNSVDSLAIHNDPYLVDGDPMLGVPTLDMTRSDSEKGTSGSNVSTFLLESPDTGWPLAPDSALAKAYDNGDLSYTEDFFNNLISLNFKFPVRTQGISSGPAGLYNLCVYWDVEVSYDLGARGQIVVGLNDEPVSRCDALPASSALSGISWSCLILCSCYLFLIFKAVRRQIEIIGIIHRSRDNKIERVENQEGVHSSVRSSTGGGNGGLMGWMSAATTWFPKVVGRDSSSSHKHGGEFNITEPLVSPRSKKKSRRHRNSHTSSPPISSPPGSPTSEDSIDLWSTLSWRDKYLYIFNLWHLVAFISSLLYLLYAVHYLFQTDDSHKDVLEDGSFRMILGLATAGMWFSLVQYLEYFPRFYLLIWTLKTGLPRVLQFFVGIFPFFIGYALLGMTLFGDESALFGDIQSTVCTLFSVVNGDSVLDVFNALAYAFPIGDIYLYIYIMIFMYVVLMSVIAIVEEAFFDSLRGQGLGIGGLEVEVDGGGNDRGGERNKNGGNCRPKRKTSIFNEDLSNSTGLVGGMKQYTPPSGQVSPGAVGSSVSAGGGGMFERERVRSKSINISSENEADGGGAAGVIGSHNSYNILGSSPATFQSRLMPAKLREVLRSVSVKRGGDSSSSSGSSSEDEKEEGEEQESSFVMDEDFEGNVRSSSGRKVGEG